jgi:hypothetical protein
VPGGRPAKTLLDRVTSNSFRPKRYGHLLGGPVLPEQPPPPFLSPPDQAVWAMLRDWQQWWQLYAEEAKTRRGRNRRQAHWDMSETSIEFSALVKHLHGGLCPVFAREKLQPDE